MASGRKVNACAASNGVPTTMELGGKSALLVFDDADVEKAVEWCMVSALPCPCPASGCGLVHGHRPACVPQALSVLPMGFANGFCQCILKLYVYALANVSLKGAWSAPCLVSLSVLPLKAERKAEKAAQGLHDERLWAHLGSTSSRFATCELALRCFAFIQGGERTIARSSMSAHWHESALRCC